ncbi:MAG: YafY family transcriptional regulator [Oscillospiraceae bacterium]|nr:YafY family transcriptional regulator [Oscillospiraceae bacterium]
MKLNRLLEITNLLLNRRSITAAELAGRFGVSVRTIYRDIDALSVSGIPVITSQGSGGGISLMEDYTVKRAALSDGERNELTFALQALKATKYPQLDALIDKIFTKPAHSDWVTVDFTPWGADPDAHERFTTVKTAILQSRAVWLEYINADNQKSEREVEPLKLIYKGQAWYMWGYCLERVDYRMFRVSRIKKVRLLERVFDRDSVRVVSPPLENKPSVHLLLVFTEDALSRLYDDYDEEMLTVNEDGTLTLAVDLPEDEWIYSYILSFGSSVCVASPEHIRRGVEERLMKTLAQYEKP